MNSFQGVPIVNLWRCLILSPPLAIGLLFAPTIGAEEVQAPAKTSLTIVGEAVRFLPGIASTEFSEIRLTLSHDGKTALWFSRDRPGGAGGYDIWITRRDAEGWTPATPVSFNSPLRDFDPADSDTHRFLLVHLHARSGRPEPGDAGGGKTRMRNNRKNYTNIF